jgi:hypothetical protein
MRDLDILVNMKSEALITAICMTSTDIGESLAAQEEFDALVDRFFTNYPQHAAPDQVVKAKQDSEYFITLLDKTIQYYRKKKLENPEG